MTFNEVWDSKIKEAKLPLYMNNLVEYDFQDFKEKVFNASDEFIESFISSLMNGDIYVIRNAVKQEVIESMKERVFNWSQNTEDSFHKILEGVPNFHRKVTKEISKNYNYSSVWDANHFFRWNKDELELFDKVDECWMVLKVLSGYKKDSFMKNTPKDILVDRLQLQHYPSGGGFLELHSDPYEIMRTLACIKMSEKGKDYEKGGIYFLNKNKEKINVEDNINVGDLYFSFPHLLHGIDPINVDSSDMYDSSNTDWNTIKGRWVMLLTMLHSNEIKQDDRASIIVY